MDGAPAIRGANAGKPAPKPRKRKSDAVESADTPSEAPAPKKKATKAGGKPDPLPDLSDIHLDGDETMSVPVYDTCQDIRTKINAQLRRTAPPRPASCCAIVKAAYPPGSDAKMARVAAGQLPGQEGPRRGQHEQRPDERLLSSVFLLVVIFDDEWSPEPTVSRLSGADGANDLWGIQKDSI
ncbi:hypothetical protein CTRI78_v001991 [Colletotrichum trifolii]|uniref:Uncharacterized protein n=1 Tax=Colletotrichum trifolii TaxID=5466 RepID=A0A4R8RND2_COLTR|nr:hypothetical protein CTRI78_v001991 [Colletotrichum trifolii]